jgi:hypothetical protein
MDGSDYFKLITGNKGIHINIYLCLIPSELQKVIIFLFDRENKTHSAYQRLQTTYMRPYINLF